MYTIDVFDMMLENDDPNEVTETEYNEEQRENDRVAAFCFANQGHTEVYLEDSPTFGGWAQIVVCAECGNEIPNHSYFTQGF